MAQDGWLRAEWGVTEKNRQARFYTITRAGRKQLALEEEELGAVAQRRPACPRLRLRRADVSWIARLVNVFRAEKVSEDIDRELAFHLEERADALIADGASPEAARREARRRFGSYTCQRENTRDRDLLVWLESFGADVRYGLRRADQESDFRGHVHPHAGNRNRGQHHDLHAAPRSAAAPRCPSPRHPSWCASMSSRATIPNASAIWTTEWSANCSPHSGRSSTSRAGELAGRDRGARWHAALRLRLASSPATHSISWGCGHGSAA